MKTTQTSACPLQCGACCKEFWRDVFEDAPKSQTKCAYQGKHGCDLEREHRPMVCNIYMCPLAEAVQRGAITRERARVLLDSNEQFGWEAWNALHNKKQEQGVQV